MADLAKASGLAKGTLYLYFKTKEEVELALFETLFESWSKKFTDLISNEKSLEKRTLVEAMLDAFSSTPELGHFSSRLHPILEQNLSLECTIEFKLKMKTRLEALSSVLALKVGAWDQPTALKFLLLAYAQINGLWQMANPSPTVRKALEDPSLSLFKINLVEDLKLSLISIAQGLQSKQNKSFHFLGSY
jgi:TetR/AcrR family transcriptional regulator